MQGLVFNIQRFSIHDGPGIRTTVFLKGCPLSCWWCHNPEGISTSAELMYSRYKCIGCKSCIASCPNHALTFNDKLHLQRELCTMSALCVKNCPTTALKIVGEWMSVEDVIRELQKDILYFDQSEGGVTFSGGEPLLQIEFLAELLPLLKLRGIHVAIDTSGYVARDDLERIFPYVDLFLYDLKVLDEHKHLLHTGVKNDIIKDNLRFLVESKQKVIIRIPLLPGVNDSIGDVHELIEFVTDLDPELEINLLPFHDVSEKYDALWKTTVVRQGGKISNGRLQAIQIEFETHGLQARIGG